MTLRILYRDESLLVLDKPEGLLSVPGRGADKYDSVATRIQSEIPDARVVHRLDCATSGVMLMSIGLLAQRELNRQFREGLVEKEYIAVVQGVVDKEQGVVDIPLRGDPDNRPVQVIDFDFGKPSTTNWSLIGKGNGRSRLLLKPITGRTHQLRVHCKSLRHPIVGDRLYGDDADAREARMLLHASTIRFNHPVSNKPMIMSSDCAF